MLAMNFEVGKNAMRRMFWRLLRFPGTKAIVGISSHVMNAFGRMAMMGNAMRYAKASNLKGDYAEFGVYGGNMFALAYHYARNAGLGDMRFFAFDSFEGLPQDDEEYGLRSNSLRGGLFAIGEEKFKKTISKKGVDLRRVVMVKGWFEKTLRTTLKREIGLEHIAVALIDCDLYSSALSALNFVTDLLVNGGILIFDDWFLFEGDPDNGEQKACREWLGGHPEIKLIDYHKYGWHGNSFIVRRI